MQIRSIRSRRNGMIQRLKSARRSKGEWADAWLIEGKRLVLEALTAGIRPLAVFCTEALWSELVVEPVVRGTEAEIYLLPPSLLREIAATVSPQGVLLAAKAPSPPDTAELPWRTLVYLEAMQDPGNLGTLLRSALAFGADAVLLGPGSCRIENEKVLRAAMGAAFRLPIVQDLPLSEVRSLAVRRGARIVAADMQGLDASACFATMQSDPLILILGNEGRGLSEEARSAASCSVRIPMAPSSESLNVAVAGSLLLYERSRSTLS